MTTGPRRILLSMHTRGYMLDVDYDGHTLTATGTTKAARVALRGADHDAGPLVLDRSEVTLVEFKPANPLVNGKLIVHTAGGQHVLHFRRKQQGGFVELARALGAQVPA